MNIGKAAAVPVIHITHNKNYFLLKTLISIKNKEKYDFNFATHETLNGYS